MCDAREGVAEQDAKILGLAEERGRGMVIALNKIDLLKKDELETARGDDARQDLASRPTCRSCMLSAKTGRGVPELFATIDRCATRTTSASAPGS